jgi:hypothetical protein
MKLTLKNKVHYGRKPIEIIGQKFNRAIVLYRVDNIGKEIAYKCKCDCGNEFISQGKLLRKNKVKKLRLF